MKLTTRIAIASLLSAAGNVLLAFSSEFGNGAEAQDTNPATPEPEKKRGRGPAKPKDEPTTTPAEPEQPATTKSDEPALPTDEQYQAWRKLIEPLVQGEGSTAELRKSVKDTVAKYAPNGLKTMDPKHGEAFEKDIAGLTY